MKQLLSNRTLFRSILLIAAVVVTFLATSRYQLKADISNGDKLVHLSAFFFLSFLAERAFPTRFTTLLVPLLIAYGGAIEFVQALLPHRTASLGDFVADLSGIWLYFICLLLLRRIYRHAT